MGEQKGAKRRRDGPGKGMLVECLCVVTGFGDHPIPARKIDGSGRVNFEKGGRRTPAHTRARAREDVNVSARRIYTDMYIEYVFVWKWPIHTFAEDVHTRLAMDIAGSKGILGGMVRV